MGDVQPQNDKAGSNTVSLSVCLSVCLSRRRVVNQRTFFTPVSRLSAVAAAANVAANVAAAPLLALGAAKDGRGRGRRMTFPRAVAVRASSGSVRLSSHLEKLLEFRSRSCLARSVGGTTEVAAAKVRKGKTITARRRLLPNLQCKTK